MFFGPPEKYLHVLTNLTPPNVRGALNVNGSYLVVKTECLVGLVLAESATLATV